MTHVVLQRHREGQKENITHLNYVAVFVQDSFVSCRVMYHIFALCMCVCGGEGGNQEQKGLSILGYEDLCGCI